MGVTFIVLGSLLAVVVYFLHKYLFADPPATPLEFPRVYTDNQDTQDSFYDVAIVGGGPGGSTCAFYLAQKHRRVVLLEKKTYPRDKYCGDALCKTAIEILIDMGIYSDLCQEGKGHVADNGGMVSPSGYSFVGRSHEQLGQIPAAVAVKRTILDQSLAARAAKEGAVVKEGWPVDSANFDAATGLWTVCKEDSGEVIKARVLVCADGSTSSLATKLGVITEPPQGTCSRSYIKAGTHNLGSDGVVFYNRDMLPGYAALFREATGELNYCCYLIPGNPEITPAKQRYWHDRLIVDDPSISRSLGPNAELEPMKAAPLRLGGVSKSYANHLLLVGDAAGMIDPLTGEGIHHAMEGGKIAAEHLHLCCAAGNFSEECMALYQQRWMNRFGYDFKWSMGICQMLYRFPILIDAATLAVQRKGPTFLARWADIMTGRLPKINLLKPEFVIVIIYELCNLLMRRAFNLPVNETTKKTR